MSGISNLGQGSPIDGAGPVDDTDAQPTTSGAAEAAAPTAADRPNIGVSREMSAAALRARVEGAFGSEGGVEVVGAEDYDADPGTVAGAAGGSAVAHTELKRGDSGPQVEELQRVLAKIGRLGEGDVELTTEFEAVADDPAGVFGPGTERALRALQSNNPQLGGISGVYDAETHAAIAGELGHIAQMAQDVDATDLLYMGDLERGAEGGEVALLQMALKKISENAQADPALLSSLDPGWPDGLFGEGTQNALRAFQALDEHRHENPDGVVNQQVRDALIAKLNELGGAQ
jgi:peptidoglycan hydrolase-like protein with peptidoglycan-binding domain